jgi:PI-3-kinase-related kinase SMG-1
LILIKCISISTKFILNIHISTLISIIQIQAILSEANEKFTKACERMISEGLPESLGRIEKAYVESKTQLANFVAREKGADKALEYVNISALCTLNKK